MHDVKSEESQLSHLSKEFLLKILDNSYDVIFATDSNGVTLYVNQACEKYFGVKPSEIIGKDPWQFVDQSGCYPPLAPIILSGKIQQTLEQTTGTGAKMVVTSTPIFDDQGNIEFLVQNCRDVQQLEQIKHDLEQTKAMLQRTQQEVATLRQREFGELTMVANSKQMKELLEEADSVAAVDINVLILGETGTGKSALAKYIHKQSPRRDGPFISINCAAIPEELMESELFGYVAGAFTGAQQKGKIGLVELANEGTLFLDEITELPLRLQGKILTVIQDHQYYPVGGATVKKVDFRIIAATNRDIKKVVEQGGFREDLYYRLSVMELEVRPLRERPEDTRALIYYFLNQFSKKYKKERAISPECRELLLDYAWPGNVRELENMMERLVAIVPGTVIDIRHLPRVFSDVDAKKMKAATAAQPAESNLLDKELSNLEGNIIIEAFRKYGSSRKVAQALNISQSRAHRLIEKYCSHLEA